MKATVAANERRNDNLVNTNNKNKRVCQKGGLAISGRKLR